MQMTLPESEYSDAPRKIAFYRQLFERIRSLPGVESAGMINNLPMGGVDINGAFGIAGRPLEQSGYASFRVASPDYFRAMNIPLIRGRLFTEADHESAEPVAIISQRVAETVFRTEDPIGQRVLSTNDATSRGDFNQPDRWPRIVGIVGDVKHFGLESRDSADLYVCYMQRPRRISGMTVVVRARDEATTLAASLRQEVKAIDKNLPVSVAAMDQVFARTTATRRFNAILVGVFAALALVLSMIGLYGVMSYAVSQSTREIGIRLALGAQTGDILKLVIGNGMILSVIGVVIGLIGAFALTRLMVGLLYGVTATDALTFVVVSLLLVIVALMACYIPARRAMKVDPMVALRYE
jgi:putative ABC transport system permease protein